MKKLLILFISFGFIGSANAEICDESSKVQDRNGVVFLPNQTEPFSGNNLCSFDNGQFKSKGRYIGGLKNGLWTEWQRNGIKISEEVYTLGVLESKTFFSDIHYEKIGKIYYINGKESSKTTWSYYPNLQMKFEQNTKNGVAHGIQTDWYENGQKMLEGNFINGKAEGTVTKWYENGNKEEEKNLKADIEDGKQTKWYENGNIESEENYKDGLLNGKSTLWHENGNKRMERIFKNALLDGKATYWYENGRRMAEVYYEDHIRTDKWIKWNEDGSLMGEVIFKDGKLKKQTSWHTNGQIKFIFHCKDGVPIGEVEGWEKNGLKYVAGSFTDGTGNFFTLYENGNKKFQTHFKDGIQVSYIIWHENGNKRQELVNKDGEVKTTYWNEDGTFDKEDNKYFNRMCTDPI